MVAGEGIQEGVLDQDGEAARAGGGVVPEGADVVLNEAVVREVGVVGGRVSFRNDEEVVVV